MPSQCGAGQCHADLFGHLNKSEPAIGFSRPLRVLLPPDDRLKELDKNPIKAAAFLTSRNTAVLGTSSAFPRALCPSSPPFVAAIPLTLVNHPAGLPTVILAQGSVQVHLVRGEPSIRAPADISLVARMWFDQLPFAGHGGSSSRAPWPAHRSIATKTARRPGSPRTGTITSTTMATLWLPPPTRSLTREGPGVSRSRGVSAAGSNQKVRGGWQDP